MSKKVSRRSYVKYAGAAVVAAAVAGTGYYYTQTRAPSKRILRVNLDAGSWGDYHKESFINKWLEDNPNVEMRLDPMSEMEATLKFITEYKETGKISSDVRPATTLNITKAFMAGIIDTDAMNPDTIPNMKDIIPEFQPWPWLPTRIYMPFGLCYNAEEVDTPPTSYEDLWDPKYKGRIAYPDWTWMGETFFWYTNQLFGGTTDDLDPGITKLRELVHDQEAKLIRKTDQGIQWFEDRDIVMAPFWLGRTNQMIGRGHPMEWIAPQGWCSLVGDWYILKTSPVVDLAQDFINASLAPEAEVIFAKVSGYPPASKKAADLLKQEDPELAARTLVPEEAFKRLGQIDFVEAINNADKALDRWNKEVIG